MLSWSEGEVTKKAHITVMGSLRLAASCFPPFSCTQISKIHGLFHAVVMEENHTHKQQVRSQQQGEQRRRKGAAVVFMSLVWEAGSLSDWRVSGVSQYERRVMKRWSATAENKQRARFHLRLWKSFMWNLFFFPLTNKILYLCVINKTFTLYQRENVPWV